MTAPKFSEALCMRVHSWHKAFVHKHLIYYSGTQKQTLNSTIGFAVKMPGKCSMPTVPLMTSDYFWN